MRNDEIAALREEAEPAPVITEPKTPTLDAPAAEPVPAALTREQLGGMLTGVVAGVARPLCRRAHVTDLERAEAEQLGVAVADVLIVYNLNVVSDPRIAAWMGLALTTMSIVAARDKLPDAPPEKIADAPAAAPVAPPPAEGGYAALRPVEPAS